MAKKPFVGRAVKIPLCHCCGGEMIPIRTYQLVKLTATEVTHGKKKFTIWRCDKCNHYRTQ